MGHDDRHSAPGRGVRRGRGDLGRRGVDDRGRVGEVMEAVLFDLPKPIRHPARYTDVLLPVFVRMLRQSRRVLDPFGGTGRIFRLNQWLPELEIEALEIEPEWAALNPRTTVGNALALPWADGWFDAVCTSPVYGNRMADTTLPEDTTYQRRQYAFQLGRKLHADNAGQLEWGDAYRAFHASAWAEARSVLCPGGLFVLNIKDHIRDGERQYVTDWHIAALEALGFVVEEHAKVPTPSYRQGQHWDRRMEYESVIALRLEALQ